MEQQERNPAGRAEPGGASSVHLRTRSTAPALYIDSAAPKFPPSPGARSRIRGSLTADGQSCAAAARRPPGEPWPARPPQRPGSCVHVASLWLLPRGSLRGDSSVDRSELRTTQAPGRTPGWQPAITPEQTLKQSRPRGWDETAAIPEEEERRMRTRSPTRRALPHRRPAAPAERFPSAIDGRCVVGSPPEQRERQSLSTAK